MKICPQDSIIDVPVRRAEFPQRAESIYHRRNLPGSLRVTAAWTVPCAFQEERADGQALDCSNAGNAYGR